MRHPSWIRFGIIMVLMSFMLSTTSFCEALDDMIDKAEEISQKLSLENISGTLISTLSEKLKALTSCFCITFAIITTGIVFSSLKSAFGSNEALFDIISTCILILSSAFPIRLCFSACNEHIEALCGYMLAFVPTSIMLYTASGSTFSAALSSSSLPIAISLIEALSVMIVLPCIKGICSLSILSALCKKTNLSGFLSFLKSICLWVMGLGFTLFTGVLSIRSLLQSGLDNLTIKGLKYGAARLIPFAGGMISESMRTVIASVSFIKNVTGVAGIVFIIFTIIPNICTIIASKFCFLALSSFAKATNQESFCAYLDSLCSVLSMLMSLVIGVSVAFIIMFAVFMKTGVTI